jgi:hypothetical protein
MEKTEQLEALPCGRGYGAVSSDFFQRPSPKRRKRF